MKSAIFIDKLNETLATCELHYKRMKFAHSQLQNQIPLTIQKYENLTPEEISFTDQLIFRFTKLQDTIGKKLFPLILEGLEEYSEEMPFIDVLNRLEKLNIIENHQSWHILRETRDQVTHEYPFNREEIIEGLNELLIQTDILSSIWMRLMGFCEHRFLRSQ